MASSRFGRATGNTWTTWDRAGNNYDTGIMKAYALPEQAPEATGQLYNLKTDPGETTNLFFTEEAKRKELQLLLEHLKRSGRSAPRDRKPVGSRTEN